MTPETTTKFGIYSGQFVPETLMLAIGDLTAGHGCCEDNLVVNWFEI